MSTASDFIARMRLEASTNTGPVIDQERAQLGELGASAKAVANDLQAVGAASARAEAAAAGAAVSAAEVAAALKAEAAAAETAAGGLAAHTQATNAASQASAARAGTFGVLQAAVQRAAADELIYAQAAREVAVAQEASAAAALSEARAFATSAEAAGSQALALAMVRDAELGLATARATSRDAALAVDVAQARVAASATTLGTVFGGLRMGAASLFELLGGPAGVALLAVQGGMLLLQTSMDRAKERTAELKKETEDFHKALNLVVQLNREHAIAAGEASGQIDKETAATLRAADAAAQHAEKLREENKALLQNGMLLAEKELATARKAATEARMGSVAPNGMMLPAPVGLADLANEQVRQAEARLAMLNDPYLRLAAQGSGRRHGGSGVDADPAGHLGGAPQPEEEAKGHERVTRAVRGRTDAEKALAEAERQAKAASEAAARSDAETRMLKLRAEAAMQGGAALEELQVKEAGLKQLEALHVTSLEQLTGKTRDAAAAAVAAAEAKERQAIATEKAEHVGTTLQDLERRIAAEKARTAAVQGSTRAEADYEREEFIRQQVEAAGKNLTAEQVAQLRAKAAALYAVGVANDNLKLAASEAEELRLLGLTRRERELDIRAQVIAARLQKEKNDLTDNELKLRARILALQDLDNEDRAQALSRLGDAVREEFIKSGKLSFDSIADYAEQQLRQAIYDSLLKEPITVLINAVVSNVSGLAGLGGTAGAAGGGSGGGVGGSLGLAGFAQSLTNSSIRMSFAATSLAQKLGASTALTHAAGAVGAASPYAIVGNVISNALGIQGYKNGLVQGLGDAAAATIGMSVGGPIGAIIATIGAHLLGGLFNGKPSNNGALSTLTGDSFSLSGDKRNDQTTQMATLASQAILQGEQMLKSAGITLSATVKSIDIGTRDATDIVLSDGRALTSAVGDAAAAAEAGLKAVLQGATYANDEQKKLVESLVAAGKGFDDIAAALGLLSGAQALPQAIADAILKLSDPKAYDVGELRKQQAARRQQVADAGASGYLSATQLAAVNDQLTRLEALELDDVMKRYAGAVDRATEKLRAVGDLKADIQEGFLKILDPVQYQLVRGAREIAQAIDAMRERAQALIATGDIGSEVLGQLDALQNLQLGQLAQQVAETTDVFAQARKGLRQWLDQLVGSPSSELSPVAQKAQALTDYQRVLGQARGGDADALSQITAYADRLLSADRNATDSAQQRLALFNQVRADVEGLASMSGGGSSSSSVAAQIKQLGIPLDKLVVFSQATANDNAQVAAAISPSLAVSIANVPQLRTMYGEVFTAQTDRVVAGLAEIKAAIGDLVAAHQQGVDLLAATTLEGLTAVEAATLAGSEQLVEIRKDGTIARATGGSRAAA